MKTKSEVDVKMMYQLTKQAIATNDSENHIKAMFIALQAKEQQSLQYLYTALAKDYFIAMFGAKCISDLKKENK